jgi:hypothetical protein
MSSILDALEYAGSVLDKPGRAVPAASSPAVRARALPRGRLAHSATPWG